MIFDQYNRVRIINLPFRVDRRREMDRELLNVGLLGNPKVAYFQALQFPDAGVFHCIGANGAFHSHLEVLQEALAVGESVVVLEDDCRFLNGIRYARCNPDTDILYGGYARASGAAELHDADIEGAHFMGFSVEALKQLVPFLQSLLDLRTPIDPKKVRSNYNPSVRPPIDGAYVWFRRCYPEYKTQFLHLAHYRISATNIGEQRWFDQLPILRGMANKARRLKEHVS